MENEAYKPAGDLFKNIKAFPKKGNGNGPGILSAK